MNCLQISLNLLAFCSQHVSTLSQADFNQVRFLLTYLTPVISWCGGNRGGGMEWAVLLTPSNLQLPLSTPSKLSYNQLLSLEDFPGVQQAMSPCSAGHSTLFSRLCYPVQQAMLPCSAGYATLFSRLCYPVQQAMLPCSARYATLFSRLCCARLSASLAISYWCLLT